MTVFVIVQIDHLYLQDQHRYLIADTFYTDKQNNLFSRNEKTEAVKQTLI